jgi:hypothetical protein
VVAENIVLLCSLGWTGITGIINIVEVAPTFSDTFTTTAINSKDIYS